MNDAEGIDKIVWLRGNIRTQLLSVRLHKTNPVRQSKQFCALSSELERFLRQINGCYRGAGTREIHRVRANAAADFEHLFPSPSSEISKSGNMGLNEVLPFLHLVEIFA